jgi:hypothetical protein
MNGQDVIAGAARALIGLPAEDCQDYPRALTRAARACYEALAPLQGGGSRKATPGELEALDRALQDLSEILDTERRIKVATEAIGKIPGGDNRLETARIERDCRRLESELDRRGTPDLPPDDLRAAREELAGSAETAAERRDWADELEALQARLTAERKQPPAPLQRPPATGTYTQPLDRVGLYTAVFNGRPIEGYTRIAVVKDTRSPSKSGDMLELALNYRELLYRCLGTGAGPYYQRVYSACASLYAMPDREAEIDYDTLFSLTEIWRKMGGTGKPRKDQLARVKHALDDMRRIIIKITDSAGRLIIDGYLLNLEFRGCRIRGGYTADAVDICRAPPLAWYFGRLKQDTQIPDEVMAVPGMKLTDANIQLQDYLNLRIVSMKHDDDDTGNKHKRKTGKTDDKWSRRILWTTLQENCPLADWTRGRRARRGAYHTLDLCLKHYRDCDFIAGYDWTDRGIEIRPD